MKKNKRRRMALKRLPVLPPKRRCPSAQRITLAVEASGSRQENCRIKVGGAKRIARFLATLVLCLLGTAFAMRCFAATPEKSTEPVKIELPGINNPVPPSAVLAAGLAQNPTRSVGADKENAEAAGEVDASATEEQLPSNSRVGG